MLLLSQSTCSFLHFQVNADLRHFQAEKCIMLCFSNHVSFDIIRINYDIERYETAVTPRSPEAGDPSHVALLREKFSARAIIICAQMKFNDALSELKLNQRGKL